MLLITFLIPCACPNNIGAVVRTGRSRTTTEIGVRNRNITETAESAVYKMVCCFVEVSRIKMSRHQVCCNNSSATSFIVWTSETLSRDFRYNWCYIIILLYFLDIVCIAVACSINLRCGVWRPTAYHVTGQWPIGLWPMGCSSKAVRDEHAVLWLLCHYYIFILLIKCRLPYLSPKYTTAADLGVTIGSNKRFWKKSISLKLNSVGFIRFDWVVH